MRSPNGYRNRPRPSARPEVPRRECGCRRAELRFPCSALRPGLSRNEGQCQSEKRGSRHKTPDPFLLHEAISLRVGLRPPCAKRHGEGLSPHHGFFVADHQVSGNFRFGRPVSVGPVQAEGDDFQHCVLLGRIGQRSQRVAGNRAVMFGARHRIGQAVIFRN